jgi:hypothetical protein
MIRLPPFSVKISSILCPQKPSVYVLPSQWETKFRTQVWIYISITSPLKKVFTDSEICFQYRKRASGKQMQANYKESDWHSFWFYTHASSHRIFYTHLLEQSDPRILRNRNSKTINVSPSLHYPLQNRISRYITIKAIHSNTLNPPLWQRSRYSINVAKQNEITCLKSNTRTVQNESHISTLLLITHAPYLLIYLLHGAGYYLKS